MNYSDTMLIRALLAHIKSDTDYNLRYVFRWYSKTFHTPLHTVERLPLDFILEHYFEDSVEQMSPEARHKKVRELLLTQEERERRSSNEDAEEADAELFRAQALEEQKKLEKEQIEEANKELVVSQQQGGSLPEPTVPSPDESPKPDIQMSFVDLSELDKEMDRLDHQYDKEPQEQS
ncbi:MAG: hypothetical protein NVS9B9_18800 [Ktedonobacteraceae bacterium]